MDELKVALRSLVQESCNALSQGLQPDFFLALMSLHAGVKNMPQTEQIIQVIRGVPEFATTLLVDGTGAPIVEEKTQRWWITDFIVWGFLHKYFNMVGSPEFSERVFGQVSEQLSRQIESPTDTVTELSPLLNVRIVPGEINIAPGLRIRQLAAGGIDGGSLQHSLPLAWHELLQLQCGIEVTYEQPRTDWLRSHQDLAKKARSLLTALRLLSDRDVYAPFTQTRSTNFFSFPGISSGPSSHRIAETAELDDERCRQLVELWDRLQESLNAQRVSLALRRWDSTAERVTEDDRLIDYWVALESLFAPDSSQEVRYRASLRVASFLGEIPGERESIYHEMLKSYDTRSVIVHGNISRFGAKKRQKFEAELPSVAKKTRAYLRKALLTILESDEPFKPEEIERHLLR